MEDANPDELLRRIQRLEEDNRRLSELLSQTAVTAHAAGLSVARLADIIGALDERFRAPNFYTALFAGTEKAAERLVQVMGKAAEND